MRLLISMLLGTALATSVAAVPLSPSGGESKRQAQPSTDNGSCEEIAAECTIFAGSCMDFFQVSEYCVLGSLCYLPTIDDFIKSVVHSDYLYIGPPLLSINQPRLSDAIFYNISQGAETISQQNFIDAYYGFGLTNTVESFGGPPGAETPGPTGQSGPWPNDVSYVIDIWSAVSAWAGFCDTREIPYQNFADYLQYSSTVQGAAASC